MRKPTKYAVISIISAALAVGVFLLGGREGYQYAFYKINQAIAKSTYPAVKVIYPTKHAPWLDFSGWAESSRIMGSRPVGFAPA